MASISAARTSLSTSLTANGSLAPVLDALGAAVSEIGELLRRPPAQAVSLAASTGVEPFESHGDQQKLIDLLAHEITVGALRTAPVAAIGSEESEKAVILDPTAEWVVAVDPLDGSSNTDINGPVGFLFGVLPNTGDPASSLLQPGSALVAAGVAVYGPSTTLLAAADGAVQLLTLDPETSDWALTLANLAISDTASAYAINSSNYRHWDDAYRAYHDELIAGADGERGRNFNTRWLAAAAAEVQRIFIEGGVYLYPGDRRPGYAEGRLRLVYEANPIAFLCRRAGGAATDGVNDILSAQPTALHQRTPLVFGSAKEVDLIGRYHRSPRVAETSPLFADRSLLRPEKS